MPREQAGGMRTWVAAIILGLLCPALPLQAADAVSMAGQLRFSAIHALDQESAAEDPSLNARVLLDVEKPDWRLHGWLEAGWDGTSRGTGEDGSRLRSLDAVYQESNPFLEFRELYAERQLAGIDCRLGVQRFAWGRLDEYPVNDLFNPWDYRQFLLKPMEERKIGVPALSATMNGAERSWQVVWVPWQVPYRLPEPDERWSFISARALFPDSSGVELLPQEPELPARTLANGSVGLRVQHLGEIDWAANLFHGFDPRPIFKTTALRVASANGGLRIDPGFVPAFHKITTLGLDGAMVTGDWGLRAEAAFTANRVFNLRPELCGYPPTPTPGVTPLPAIEVERDTADYGIAGDYRLFEDALLTLQAQQTAIFERPETLYERAFETMLWANLRVQWLNQKLETTLNLACNPEHGAKMLRAGISYVVNDFWKAGVTAALLEGPPASVFGRYGMNDQLGLEVTYSW